MSTSPSVIGFSECVGVLSFACVSIIPKSYPTKALFSLMEGFPVVLLPTTSQIEEKIGFKKLFSAEKHEYIGIIFISFVGEGIFLDINTLSY